MPHRLSVQHEVINILRRAGALIEHTHVVGTSGTHIDTYVEKYALYPNVTALHRIGQLFCDEFGQDGIQAVIAPAKGGIALSQWVTFSLVNSALGARPIALFAEPGEHGLIIGHGYGKKLDGRRTLIIDDVYTSGLTLQRLTSQVVSYGGIVAGIGVMCSHGTPSREAVGLYPEVPGAESARVVSLAVIDSRSWDTKKEQCALCAEGRPIDLTHGHGRAFVA